MPRDRGGIGRTGNKHKKKATHDLKRRPKSSEDDAIQPSATALDDVTNLAEQLNAGALASVLFPFAQDSNHSQCARPLLCLAQILARPTCTMSLEGPELGGVPA